MARWSQPTSYPDLAVAGPVVALTNEHSGSDGDIFSHGFKLMKIGPLVGTRTWGGVIGINPRHTLVDGTQTTQPEFSLWFKDVGWGVENYGTDPDIKVDNAPQDAVAQRDRQLETAIETALDLIARNGTSKPEFGTRPVLRRPRFPLAVDEARPRPLFGSDSQRGRRVTMISDSTRSARTGPNLRKQNQLLVLRRREHFNLRQWCKPQQTS